MNLSNYYQLQSYCWHLAGSLYRDLLHDAYVKWYEKTGNNLFNEPNVLGAKVIRNIHFNNLQKQMWTYRGRMYRRHNIEATSGRGDQGREGNEDRGVYVPEYRVTPYDFSNGKELLARINTSPEVGMVLEGYSQVEIASRLKKSTSLVNYYVTKAKKKLSQLVNPIAGSRVKVIKRVSVKQVPSLEGYVKTAEGNETVDIYIKESELDRYEQSGQADEGVLVKLTKD